MNRVLVLLILAAALVCCSFAQTPSTPSNEFSILSHKLGETEQEARSLASLENMDHFVCGNVGTSGRICGARGFAPADAQIPNLVMSFLDDHLVLIVYEFYRSDFDEVVRTLETKYGPASPPAVAPKKGTRSLNWSNQHAHLFALAEKGGTMSTVMLADSEKSDEFSNLMLHKPKI